MADDGTNQRIQRGNVKEKSLAHYHGTENFPLSHDIKCMCIVVEYSGKEKSKKVREWDETEIL